MNQPGRLLCRLWCGVLATLLIVVGSPRSPAPVQAGETSSGDTRKPAGGAPPAPARLEIRGEGIKTLTFSAEELAALPRKTVRAKAHDGVESEYQGVPLHDLLARAGAPTGDALKGRKALSLYLVVEASDDYRVVFALAELDPGFADRTVILADRRDGRPLSHRDGPLQVIVPGEKKHGRWVRQVVRLVVGRA